MMKEFDLDDFKNSWQQQNKIKTWDSNDILALIKGQSKNHVAFILYLSLAEMLVFFVLPSFFLDAEKWDVHDVKYQNPLLLKFLEYLFDGLNVLTNLYFIILFIKTYRALNLSLEIKIFNELLLKFKKNAIWYVRLNLCYSFLFSVFICAMLYVDANSEPWHEKPLVFFSIMALSLALVVALQYAYFRWVYGYFFNKISLNLMKIDQIEKALDQ